MAPELTLSAPLTLLRSELTEPDHSKPESQPELQSEPNILESGPRLDASVATVPAVVGAARATAVSVTAPPVINGQ